ncbi:MAG: helix-turn-helix transcriptional regulator [Bacteroidota bacterium]
MIGDAFKAFIISQGLSPEEFADKLSVGKSSIYKIIGGQTKKISFEMAKKINKVFQVPIEEVLQMNTKTSSAAEATNPAGVKGLSPADKTTISSAFLLHEEEVVEIPVVKLWLKNELLKCENRIMREIQDLKTKGQS